MTTTTPHDGRLWRRVANLSILIAVMAMLLPTVAAAARPTTTVDTTYGVRPPRITTDAGTLDFFMFFSDVNGPVAELSYWEPGEIPGIDPALIGIEGPTIVVDGDLVIGDLWVLDPQTHEFVGLAVYELTFTPIGSATTEDITRQDGNVRFLQTTIRQRMAVSGTLTMPDGVVMPIEAEGSQDTFVTWTTAPAARVDEGTQTLVGADWIIDDQPLFFRSVRTALAAEAALVLAEPMGEVAGYAQPTWTGDSMVAEMDLIRDRVVVGSARFELTVTPVSSSWHFELSPGKRLKVTVEQLAVVGTATVTIDGVTRELSIDSTNAFGERQSWHGAQRPMKGGDDDGGGGEG